MERSDIDVLCGGGGVILIRLVAATEAVGWGGGIVIVFPYLFIPVPTINNNSVGSLNFIKVFTYILLYAFVYVVYQDCFILVKIFLYILI